MKAYWLGDAHSCEVQYRFDCGGVAVPPSEGPGAIWECSECSKVWVFAPNLLGEPDEVLIWERITRRKAAKLIAERDQ